MSATPHIELPTDGRLVVGSDVATACGTLRDLDERAARHMIVPLMRVSSMAELRVRHLVDEFTGRALSQECRKLGHLLGWGDDLFDSIIHSDPPHTYDLSTSPDAIERRRWIVGHHLFHVVVLAVERTTCLAIEAVKSNSALVFNRISDLQLLLAGSGALLRYAGAMSAESYAIMRREFPNQGFSGALNIEHRQMLRAIGSLRALLSTNPDYGEAAARNRALLAGLELGLMFSVAGHVHGSVCRALVPSGISLRGNDVLGVRRSSSPPEVVAGVGTSYDEWFGIVRVDRYSVGDFAGNALRAASAVVPDMVHHTELDGLSIYLIACALVRVFEVARTDGR